MTQEYDIGEFWEQYDERSVYIGTKHQDDFITLLDDFISEEEKKANENDLNEECRNETLVKVNEDKKRKNQLQDDEKIIKKMYGIREKHHDLMTEEDRIIKNRIEEIFLFMKNQNT